MKTSITIIVFLLIFVISCVKTEKQYHSNGQLQSEIQYKRGLRHGTAIYFYPNGTKQLQSNYYESKLNGALKKWRKDGSLESIEHYKNDTLHGVSQKFFDNGRLHHTIHYYKGVLDGEYLEYHENGLLNINGSFKNGFYHGKWKYFNPSGFLIGRANYNLGTGVHVSFHAYSSDTLVKTEYYENLKHGTEIWFNKDGSIKEIRLYKKGVLSRENQNN